MKQRRAFNFRERMALLMSAGDHCASCGVLLTRENFHADHVVPFHVGGVTDVINGQALCASCNLRKGGRTVKKLRKWQQECLDAIAAHPSNNFLVIACPASGKTNVLIEQMLRHKAKYPRDAHFIIVAPTVEVVMQIASAARSVGIYLDSGSNGDIFPLRRDCNGYVVTYQAIAANPEAHRMFANGAHVFAGCDEIHHVIEDRSWGDALAYALERVGFRLFLSGTAFRADTREKIAFLKYDEDGNVLGDFPYSYSQALLDGVCRYIAFETFDGDAEWTDTNGDVVKATFVDQLNKQDTARRLRTTIDPAFKFAQNMFAKADRHLDDIRRRQPDAGGLVICENQYAARKVAMALAALTGAEPTVVISEDTGSRGQIKRFRNSREKWIVAVKMITEGVDIPRLRVGVYLTNVKSELFFRQVIGRFVRKQPSFENDHAFLYMPRDPDLLELAQRIEAEVRVAKCEIDERQTRERTSGESSLAEEWTKLGADGDKAETILSGANYDSDVIQRARHAVSVHDLTISEFQLASAFQTMNGFQEQHPTVTPREELNNLKSQMKVIIGKIVKRRNGGILPRGDDALYRTTRTRLNKSVGLARNQQPTTNQMRMMIQEGMKWLSHLS